MSKHARVKTLMVVALWGFGVAWSPARAVGQCCGDCNRDGSVTVDEIITGVNHALGSCSDDGVCDASVKQCGDDAVVAGTVCMDKYEASVWRVPNPTTTKFKSLAIPLSPTDVNIPVVTNEGECTVRGRSRSRE